MEIAAFDPETFGKLLTWVVGVSALAATAVIGVTGALMSPTLLGRFIGAMRRGAKI